MMKFVIYWTIFLITLLSSFAQSRHGTETILVNRSRVHQFDNFGTNPLEYQNYISTHMQRAQSYGRRLDNNITPAHSHFFQQACSQNLAANREGAYFACVARTAATMKRDAQAIVETMRSQSLSSAMQTLRQHNSWLLRALNSYCQGHRSNRCYRAALEHMRAKSQTISTLANGLYNHHQNATRASYTCGQRTEASARCHITDEQARALAQSMPWALVQRGSYGRYNADEEPLETEEDIESQRPTNALDGQQENQSTPSAGEDLEGNNERSENADEEEVSGAGLEGNVLGSPEGDNAGDEESICPFPTAFLRRQFCHPREWNQQEEEQDSVTACEQVVRRGECADAPLSSPLTREAASNTETLQDITASMRENPIIQEATQYLLNSFSSAYAIRLLGLNNFSAASLRLNLQNLSRHQCRPFQATINQAGEEALAGLTDALSENGAHMSINLDEAQRMRNARLIADSERAAELTNLMNRLRVDFAQEVANGPINSFWSENAILRNIPGANTAGRFLDLYPYSVSELANHRTKTCGFFGAGGIEAMVDPPQLQRREGRYREEELEQEGGDAVLVELNLVQPFASGRILSRAERCEMKVALLNSYAREMNQIFRRSPELAARASENGPPLFAEIMNAREEDYETNQSISPDERRRRRQMQILGANLETSSARVVEALRPIRESIQRICENPQDAVAELFSNDEMLNNFLSCGGKIRLPLNVNRPARQTINGERIPESCINRIALASNICALRSHAQERRARGELAGALLSTTFDSIGFLGLGVAATRAVGSVATSGIRATSAHYFRSLFSREAASSLVVGTAIAGGISSYMYYETVEESQRTIARYYAGEGTREEYEGALNAIREAEASLTRDMVSGVIMDAIFFNPLDNFSPGLIRRTPESRRRSRNGEETIDHHTAEGASSHSIMGGDLPARNQNELVNFDLIMHDLDYVAEFGAGAIVLGPEQVRLIRSEFENMRLTAKMRELLQRLQEDGEQVRISNDDAIYLREILLRQGRGNRRSPLIEGARPVISPSLESRLSAIDTEINQRILQAERRGIENFPLDSEALIRIQLAAEELSLFQTGRRSRDLLPEHLRNDVDPGTEGRVAVASADDLHGFQTALRSEFRHAHEARQRLFIAQIDYSSRPSNHSHSALALGPTQRFPAVNTRARQQDFIAQYNTSNLRDVRLLGLPSVAQNRAYLELFSQSRQRVVFNFEMPVLKAGNDSLGRDFMTATENFAQRTLLNVLEEPSMAALKRSIGLSSTGELQLYTGFKSIEGAIDFDAYRIAKAQELGVLPSSLSDDVLGRYLEADFNRLYQETTNRFVQHMQGLGLELPEGLPELTRWNNLGLSRIPPRAGSNPIDEAALSARRQRERISAGETRGPPTIGVFTEDSERYVIQNTAAVDHNYRQLVRNLARSERELARRGFLMEIPERFLSSQGIVSIRPQYVISPAVMGILRKASSDVNLVRARILNQLGMDISPENIQLLLDYYRASDNLSPPIHAESRGSLPLERAVSEGGVSDLAQLGGLNGFWNAAAARAAVLSGQGDNTSAILGLFRAAEQRGSTPQFQARVNAMTEAVQQVLGEDYVVVSSGDDLMIILERRSGRDRRTSSAEGGAERDVGRRLSDEIDDSAERQQENRETPIATESLSESQINRLIFEFDALARRAYQNPEFGGSALSRNTYIRGPSASTAMVTPLENFEKHLRVSLEGRVSQELLDSRVIGVDAYVPASGPVRVRLVVNGTSLSEQVLMRSARENMRDLQEAFPNREIQLSISDVSRSN